MMTRRTGYVDDGEDELGEDELGEGGTDTLRVFSSRTFSIVRSGPAVDNVVQKTAPSCVQISRRYLLSMHRRLSHTLSASGHNSKAPPAIRRAVTGRVTTSRWIHQNSNVESACANQGGLMPSWSPAFAVIVNGAETEEEPSDVLTGNNRSLTFRVWAAQSSLNSRAKEERLGGRRPRTPPRSAL